MYAKIIFNDLSFRTLSNVQKVITSETENYDNIDIYTKKTNKERKFNCQLHNDKCIMTYEEIKRESLAQCYTCPYNPGKK